MKHILMTILLLSCLFSHDASAQELIKGRVVDQFGYGLAFVDIYDLNDEIVTQTDESGGFSITDVHTDVLVFRLEGYLPIREKIDRGQGDMTLEMVQDIRTADINVAFTKQQALGSTAAISSVSSADMNKTFVPNLANTLFGRLPGLTVMQGSGEPGYDSPNMLIRGQGTYQDNGFLVFVDGLETSFEHLSVHEVQSVSVLKDAAALSQFGIRGANGALWVTTKRGEVGKTRITLDARNGWQSPVALPSFVGSFDYASLYNEALQNDGLSPRYTDQDLEAYRTGSDPYLYPDVNWYDEVLRKSAPQRDINLTFSGGGNTARYFVLLGYNRTEGLYDNTDSKRIENSNADFQRYNFRANVDMQLSQYVTASMDLGGRVEDRAFPNFNGGDLWNNMARFPANAYPVRNPNNSWGGNALFFDNPVASVLDRGLNTTTDRNLLANLQLVEKLDFITEGLSLRQAVAFNNWHRGHYDKTRNIAVYEITGKTNGTAGEEYTYRQHGTRTDLAVNQGGNNQWNRTNLQFSAHYDRSFGLNALSAQVMYYQDLYQTSGNNVPYATQNIMGRVHYGYNDTYFAELGFSYSGSERFPPGKRFGFFPSLSTAWIVSNESFLKDNQTINFLKARASVGLLGNDRLIGQRFAYRQDYYYDGSYHFGPDYNGFGTVVEGVAGNPNISWEKSLQTNIGVEATLFHKLNISLDAFYENRWDILASGDATVPGYVGISSGYFNYGKVKNIGGEAVLTFSDKIGDLTYQVGGSVFYTRNKILEMNEVVRAESYLYQTGQQVGQPFGLQAVGFWQTGDFDASGNVLNGLPVSTFSRVQPGDIRYVDQNNDGLINENDFVPIGHSNNPSLTYTFNIGAAYKGFDVSAFLHGIGERSIFMNGTYFFALQNDNNIPSIAMNRWTVENAANADYPRLSTLPNDNNYNTSTFWMRSGSAIRLRNVELGYTLPGRLQDQARLKDFRIYVNGVNLWTSAPINGFDPEYIGGYPPLKSYNIGLTARF
ncbi:TonB-dependent receptor [Sphingobacterium sp. DN00404]|uniref:TonB-dependent receptor n=1 Tax=Sphingobacterium micropteri TaxID=2763501 RepID=A0ABR7YLJ0_9SPHI|nr:TonB-dependent receptor [Sphingobacterium micropteri]MBD1432190.1 TonB-dependent receptor [Sphingobacterium micropteri]